MKQVSAGTTTTTTYYIRDAQGNVLAVYTRNNNDPVKWSEQHLYGSSRLGMWRWDTIVPASAPVIGNNDYIYDSITLGSRTYELANHLGNVLATISDKKIGVDSNGVVKNYIAEVLSQNDYYPFGMGMPARSSDGSRYRYGFNGKENDSEIDIQNYGARIYNSKLGRFLSVDPLTSKYPELTPYQYAGNKPVWCIDLDGLEDLPYTWQIKEKVLWNNAKTPAQKQVLIQTERKVRNSFVLAFALASDFFITKGWATRTFLTMEGASALYHNKANSKEESNERGRQILHTSADIAGGYVLGKVGGHVLSEIEFRNVAGIESKVPNFFDKTLNEKVFNSATAESKNGLTVVGRALQKHAGREGSSFADIKFSGKTGNQQGVHVMNEILNSTNQFIDDVGNGTKTIFDKNTGRGVNISRNGTFNGFRDLKELKK